MYDYRSVSGLLLASLYILPFFIYLKYALGMPSEFLLTFDIIVLSVFFLSVLALFKPGAATAVPMIGVFLVILGVALIFHPNIPSVAVGLEGLRKSHLFIVSIVVGCCFVQRVEVFIGSFLIILSIYVLYGLKQYLFMSSVDYAILSSQYSDKYTFLIGGLQRISGLFSSPFILGAASCFGLILSLYRLDCEGGKLVSLALIVLFLVGVALSVTRTNMIVSVFIILFWLFLKFQEKPALQLLSILSAFFLLLTALIIAPDVWIIMSEDDRFYNRFHMWDTVFNQVFMRVDGLMFGYGTGASGDTLASKYAHYQFEHVSSHNIFLRYFFEGGLFLGLLFSAFVLGLILQGFKVRERFVYFASLSIILIGGFSYSSVEIWPVNIMIGLLLGGILAGHQRMNFYVSSSIGRRAAGNGYA